MNVSMHACMNLDEAFSLAAIYNTSMTRSTIGVLNILITRVQNRCEIIHVGALLFL